MLATLGLTIERFLERLRDAGLGTLPGTAAEILDDDVRALICPDKLTTCRWLRWSSRASVGLRTTATIMFGHVDRPVHWARHLLRIRRLQERTADSPNSCRYRSCTWRRPCISRVARARGRPTASRVLMHAVSRLVLHPLIPNIQVSWVKIGEEGVACLPRGGANDLGGTLMNESISRAAGTLHGQEMRRENGSAHSSAGRSPRQRTTLYATVTAERRAASLQAAPLADMVQTPFTTRRYKAAPAAALQNV